MLPNESFDVAEIAAQRREAELDASQCEWTQIPPAPQPGQFALEASLAIKVGLEPGEHVNADEWTELMLFSRGLPASHRSRKKDVRPFVWDIFLETKKPDRKN